MNQRHHTAAESPYPHPMPAATRDVEPVFDKAYVDRLHRQLQASLDDVAQYFVDITNRVDEFRVQSLAGESLTTESLQPDYECDEIITGVIVTGPASSQTTTVQTAPAAGANFIYTNQTGAPQSLLAAQATFVTDAVVGNRKVSLQISDAGGHVIASVIDGTLIVASSTITIDAYQGATQTNAASGTTILPIPQNIIIPPGGTVQFLASGIDAGDQWSAINLTFGTASTGTPFTLQLGKRAWPLLLPVTGILVIAPVQFKLGRSDNRLLNAAVPGDWSFELMGYAETGRRGRV